MAFILSEHEIIDNEPVFYEKLLACCFGEINI